MESILQSSISCLLIIIAVGYGYRFIVKDNEGNIHRFYKVRPKIFTVIILIHEQ